MAVKIAIQRVSLLCLTTRTWQFSTTLGVRTSSLGLCQCYSSDASKNSQRNSPLKKPNTPVGRHDDPEKHQDAEKEPLAPFPDDINPYTGEKGGPRGPEPTRYGDWERKGRCIDF